MHLLLVFCESLRFFVPNKLASFYLCAPWFRFPLPFCPPVAFCLDFDNLKSIRFCVPFYAVTREPLFSPRYLFCPFLVDRGPPTFPLPSSQHGPLEPPPPRFHFRVSTTPPPHFYPLFCARFSPPNFLRILVLCR